MGSLVQAAVVFIHLVGAAPAATPGTEAAPDPRRGERLDGRAPPEEPASAGRAAARVALMPVRGLVWLFTRPVDAATGFVERHRLWHHAYEAFTSDDRLRGVRPIIRWDTGYYLSGGVDIFDRRTLGPGSLLGLSVRAGVTSLSSQLKIEPPGATGLRFEGTFVKRTDGIFAGTHGETRDELAESGLEPVRYGETAASGRLLYGRRLGTWLALSVESALERRRYDDGTTRYGEPNIRPLYCVPPGGPDCAVDPNLVPGFEEGLRLVRGRAGLVLDTRTYPRFGTGVTGQLTAIYSHGIAGDPSQHIAILGAVGGAVGWGDHALTLRVRADVVERLADAPIPFEDLPSASGLGGVRGIAYGRLRGASVLVGTIEYRWLVATWLDAVLFFDRGNAFRPHFDGLAWDNLFSSFGIGVIVLQAGDPAHHRRGTSFSAAIALSKDPGLSLSFSFDGY
jgi:hypothetical protein